MIVIIDYGTGNLTSVANMLKKAGADDIRIAQQAEDVLAADKIILPGVGAFEPAMRKLMASPCYEPLLQKVNEESTPVMGICLGAQLLLEGSEEGTPIKGLSWVKGRVIRFQENQMPPTYKVPHMGWTDVQIRKSSPLWSDMHENPRFYFVHAYHMVADNAEDVLLSADYGYPFVAAIERANIIGVQFHPEKSHKYGLKLFQNFIRYY